MVTVVNKADNTAPMIGLLIVALLIALAVFVFGQNYFTPTTNTYHTTKIERTIYDREPSSQTNPDLNIEINPPQATEDSSK